jgi:hypothetical protein
MRPPTSGIQASAAAMLEGNPVDCVVGFPTGGVSGGGFGFGGIGSGGGPGDDGGIGSKGSAMVLLDEIDRLFVK